MPEVSELPRIEPSATVATLARLGARRLDDMALVDVQAVRRRIVAGEDDVPRVPVAAFGSFIV